MKHAYVFPGQGSQHTGMGKNLYNSNPKAKAIFDEADEILGFKISDIMFNGTDEQLKQTNITQPAIFIDSVAAFVSIDNPQLNMVAGHSLGEFTALVANRIFTFKDGLQLVAVRAKAMQRACEVNPSTMAAITNLDDATVEQICAEVQHETGEVVVPANYNCPGQLVISGTNTAVEKACEKAKSAGAKRALLLPVSGAFHSPLMEPAKQELVDAINKTTFATPICPVYQNVSAQPEIDIAAIRANLIAQLTGPVKWTQSVQHMVADGATEFTECGPGKILHGLIKKIAPDVTVYNVGNN